ncbi:MAG: hypothetical protein JXB48_17960 [Candidatus Latescibacteria bacterium]|nr:hypothetical protein [Candidatus Latescibacterota bacterium]
MAAIYRKMMLLKVFITIFLLFNLFLLSTVLSARIEAETMKSRQYFHIVKTEMVEVGDTPGHVVGYIHNAGLVEMENGEIGTYEGWYTFDYTNGSGKFSGYAKNTFEDGSTQLTEIDNAATTAMQGGKVSELKGKFTFISGSGRYKGIKGTGTFSGKRVSPLDLGADGYSDISSTYTVP